MSIVHKFFDQLGVLLFHGQDGRVQLDGEYAEVWAEDNLYVDVPGELIVSSMSIVDISGSGNVNIYSTGGGTFGAGGTGLSRLSSSADKVELSSVTGIMMFGIKSGVSQAAAGAVAGELWRNTVDNGLHIGV